MRIQMFNIQMLIKMHLRLLTSPFCTTNMDIYIYMHLRLLNRITMTIGNNNNILNYYSHYAGYAIYFRLKWCKHEKHLSQPNAFACVQYQNTFYWNLV